MPTALSLDVHIFCDLGIYFTKLSGVGATQISKEGLLFSWSLWLESGQSTGFESELQSSNLGAPVYYFRGFC